MADVETRTLLCGDLFTHLGDVAPITTEDIVVPAMEAEAMFRGAGANALLALAEAYDERYLARA
jgi:hypothetical protein